MDKRPPPDDPDFDRRLDELDRGLSGPPEAHRDDARGVAGRPLLDLFPPPPRSGTGSAPSSRRRQIRLVPELEALVGARAPHEPFYGFTEPPFHVAPEAKFLYHSAAFDRVMQRVGDGAAHGERLMVVTGEIGTGKTTVCRSLADSLGSSAIVAPLLEAVSSFEELLSRALGIMGATARGTPGSVITAARVDLTIALIDFARSRPSPVVIAVDEAHNLPLDVLQPLCELATSAPTDTALTIVLVGQPALASLFDSLELRAFRGATVNRAELAPLTFEELQGYVGQRMRVAGPGVRVEFDEHAFPALYRITRGLPRLVNLVCERALERGHEQAASVIDVNVLWAAADDVGVIAGARSASSRAELALRGAVFVLLMSIGASAAVWVFRDAIAAILAAYR
jgi:general secretion pathway protein A